MTPLDVKTTRSAALVANATLQVLSIFDPLVGERLHSKGRHREGEVTTTRYVCTLSWCSGLLSDGQWHGLKH